MLETTAFKTTILSLIQVMLSYAAGSGFKTTSQEKVPSMFQIHIMT